MGDQQVEQQSVSKKLAVGLSESNTEFAMANLALKMIEFIAPYSVTRHMVGEHGFSSESETRELSPELPAELKDVLRKSCSFLGELMENSAARARFLRTARQDMLSDLTERLISRPPGDREELLDAVASVSTPIVAKEMDEVGSEDTGDSGGPIGGAMAMIRVRDMQSGDSLDFEASVAGLTGDSRKEVLVEFVEAVAKRVNELARGDQQ